MLILNVDDIKKTFTVPFLNYNGVFSKYYCCYDDLLCYENKTTCSPMVGQVFDTMIVASSDKEWL